MEINRLQVGSLNTNCYLVHSNGDIAIIDPGGEADKIKRSVEDLNEGSTHSESSPCIRFILATHSHWDHVGALDVLASEYGSPLLIGKGETTNYEESGLTTNPERELEEGDHLSVGTADFKVWSTPGHSPGSITLLQEAEKRAIVGDLIFAGGFGRTDLPGGSPEDLKASIRRVLQLGEEWKLYPGHGEVTTIGKELDRSPFLKDQFLRK